MEFNKTSALYKIMKNNFFLPLAFFAIFFTNSVHAQTTVSEENMWQALEKNLGYKNHEILCQVPSDDEMVWLIGASVSQSLKILKVGWRQPDEGDSVKVYFLQSEKTMFVGENVTMVDLTNEPVMTQTIISTVFHCLTPEFDTFTNTYRLSLNLLVNKGELGFGPDSTTQQLYFSESFDDGEVMIAAQVGDPQNEVFAYWLPKNPVDGSLYGRVTPKGEVFWEKKKGNTVIRLVGPDWRGPFFMHWLDMIGIK